MWISSDDYHTIYNALTSDIKFVLSADDKRVFGENDALRNIRKTQTWELDGIPGGCSDRSQNTLKELVDKMTLVRMDATMNYPYMVYSGRGPIAPLIV